MKICNESQMRHLKKLKSVNVLSPYELMIIAEKKLVFRKIYKKNRLLDLFKEKARASFFFLEKKRSYLPVTGDKPGITETSKLSLNLLDIFKIHMFAYVRFNLCCPFKTITDPHGYFTGIV